MVNSKSRTATRSIRRTHTKQTRSSVSQRATTTRETTPIETAPRMALRATTARVREIATMGMEPASIGTETSNDYFMTNEGDDNIESSFSFLIGLMGSSAFELFVRDFNAETGERVQVVQVDSPMNVFKIPLTPKEIKKFKPTIYYGKKNATHFTCSTDGKHLQNSYTDFQLNDFQQRPNFPLF